MNDSIVELNKNSLHHELILVEYPGLVKNDTRMLETLGGIKKISNVFYNEKLPLVLRFHPDNVYNKPTSGECYKNFGFLLKIKIRRRKGKKNADSHLGLNHSVKIMGKCNRAYKFNSLCDFQYLPFVQVNDTVENIYNKTVPQDIFDHDIFLKASSSLFCVPLIFSRTDSVCHKLHRKEEDKNESTNEILGQVRGKSDSTESQAFNLTDPFPMKPNPSVAKKMMVKYVSDEQLDQVKQLFEECPIWNRIALMYESGVSNDKLKCIIPSVAYYFTTGPWRTMYVRYGYDPRKDFQSRFYQTFDYRWRYGTGIAEYVKCRASTKKTLKYDHSTSKEIQNFVQDLNYPYFEEGTLPRSRQCHFRYCDIRIPKIQDMLKKLSIQLPGVSCNEKSGWLPAAFHNQCRQIIANIIKDQIKILHQQQKLKATTEELEQEILLEDTIDDDQDESESDDDDIANKMDMDD